MIRVGIVGLGFMGRMHYRCWKSQPGATIAAICEANPKVLAEAGAAPKGNVQGAADDIDLTGVQTFTDFDAMLASGAVDAISLTLPTFVHPDATIKALEAGVHVLCEKPMALNPAECDRMIAAAEKTGKILQIGHCIRFWPEYVVARDLIQSGEYGKPIAATFRRFSTAPNWSPDNWFSDESRSGGQPLDLHIHDSDFIHYAFGLPAAVSSIADLPQAYISSQYFYPGGPAVVAESTWRMAPTFGFEMSFNIVFEKATLVFDCTRTPAFRLCPAEGEAFTPELPPGDGYTREIDHFARVVAGETVPAVVTPFQSRETVRLILAEKESAREGRRVEL